MMCGRGLGYAELVVFVAGGATLVAGGVATWSALDTVAQKDRFDPSPAQALFVRFERGKREPGRAQGHADHRLGIAGARPLPSRIDRPSRPCANS